MKQLIILLISFISVFSACKKGDSAPEPASLTEVTFSVSGFSEHTEPLGKTGATISSSADTLRKYTDSIYYHIRNSAGFVKSGLQTKDSPTYGTIKETLAPGNYEINFTGLNGNVVFANESDFSRGTITPVKGYWEDVFWTARSVGVGSTPVQVNVNMTRQTGAIDLQIFDAIPQGTAVIELTTGTDIKKLSFNANSQGRGQNTQRFFLTDADAGMVNKRFFMYAFNYGSLTIKAYDKSGKITAEKFIPSGVDTSPNSIAKVSGRLFSIGSSSFQITVNPVWNPSGPPIAF